MRDMSGWIWGPHAVPGRGPGAGAEVTLAGTHARERSREAPSERSQEASGEREARTAIAIAGGLYFVGALLCSSAALLPHVSSPAGVTAVALDALLSAGLLLLAARRGWGGLGLAYAAELWGVLVIAVLCASGGGAESPFALIYFFALGHAAAFQPRARVIGVSSAALVAFLAPLAYEPHVAMTFAAFASVGIVLALLAAMVLHTALSTLREQRRRLEILIAATAELDRSLDPAQTLRTIAHMVVPELAELCVIDLLDERGSVGTTVAGAARPELAAEVEQMRDEHERFMREHGYVRAAVFPMIARGRTLGAISFLQLQGSASYDHGMLAVLEDLAGRAAMAFDNARLYAERAQVARTLRRSLMPAMLPTIPGLELASYFRPSGARSEVGGDFYDVFGGRESCWLVVGDVCGKGAEAAAITAFLRHTTAAYAREGSGPVRRPRAGQPGDARARVRRTLRDGDPRARPPAGGPGRGVGGARRAPAGAGGEGRRQSRP